MKTHLHVVYLQILRTKVCDILLYFTFVDLQMCLKCGDIVDYNILLTIRGVMRNDWFRLYLNNRKQYVSIHGVGFRSSYGGTLVKKGLNISCFQIFLLSRKNENSVIDWHFVTFFFVYLDRKCLFKAFVLR